MRDRQISVRRVVNELATSKSSILEIMNNYLDMSKACTRWVPKLLMPIQRMNRVECCQELLQEIDANPVKFLDRIVTGDEFWIYHSTRSQVLEEVGRKNTDTTWSAGKVMMTIFRDKDGIRLIHYPARENTIHGLYYALLIERLHSAILKKRRGKVSQ